MEYALGLELRVLQLSELPVPSAVEVSCGEVHSECHTKCEQRRDASQCLTQVVKKSHGNKDHAFAFVLVCFLGGRVSFFLFCAHLLEPSGCLGGA